MRDDINVVLFSDHGMTELKWMEKVIELDHYIDMTHIIKMMDRGPVVSLWPKQDRFEEVSSACLTRVYSWQQDTKNNTCLFSICHFEGKKYAWCQNSLLWTLTCCRTHSHLNFNFQYVKYCMLKHWCTGLMINYNSRSHETIKMSFAFWVYFE